MNHDTGTTTTEGATASRQQFLWHGIATLIALQSLYCIEMNEEIEEAERRYFIYMESHSPKTKLYHMKLQTNFYKYSALT